MKAWATGATVAEPLGRADHGIHDERAPPPTTETLEGEGPSSAAPFKSCASSAPRLRAGCGGRTCPPVLARERRRMAHGAPTSWSDPEVKNAYIKARVFARTVPPECREEFVQEAVLAAFRAHARGVVVVDAYLSGIFVKQRAGIFRKRNGEPWTLTQPSSLGSEDDGQEEMDPGTPASHGAEFQLIHREFVDTLRTLRHGAWFVDEYSQRDRDKPASDSDHQRGRRAFSSSSGEVIPAFSQCPVTQVHGPWKSDRWNCAIARASFARTACAVARATNRPLRG